MKKPTATFMLKMALSSMTLAILLSVTGCSTLPLHSEIESQSKLVKSSTDGWNATPAIERIRVGGSQFDLKGPTQIPAKLASKIIDISGPSAQTLKDYAALLSAEGIIMVISDGTRVSLPTGPDAIKVAATPSSPDRLGDREASLPKFHGELKDLLQLLSIAMNCSFHWSNGAIIATTGRQYVMELPQDEALITRVIKTLTSMGAEDVNGSVDAGTISFISPQDKAPLLTEFINKIRANNGMIGLQVSIINVSINQARNTGMDWSALQTVIGTGIESTLNAAATTAAATTAAATTAAATTAVTTAIAPVAPQATGPFSLDMGSLARPASAGFNNNGMTLALGGGDFRMTSLIHFLSTYGKTTVTQNLILRTLSGNKVEINSGKTTPYVSGVTVAAATTAGGANLGGAQTANLDTGLNLSLTPNFDNQSGLVTMDMKLKMSTLLAMVPLDAGKNLGTLNQPQTQKQEFNDVARLMAGQTVVLGGIVYDEVSDNRSTLPGMERYEVGNKDSKSQKTAMFVVIRPTVMLYEQK